MSGCLKLKNLLPAYKTLVQRAREHNVTIVVDHGRVAPGVSEVTIDIVRELVLVADFYLPSRDEFFAVWQVTSIEEGLHKLAAQSKVTTIVKDAENGAYILIDGKLQQVLAFSTEIHNTVGAGDSFNAGVIQGQATGKNLLESIRLGCATASLKISNQPVDRNTIERMISF